jgi:hypothetical protein
VKFLLDHDVPGDLSYLLSQLGRAVAVLRGVLPVDAPAHIQPHNGIRHNINFS